MREGEQVVAFNSAAQHATSLLADVARQADRGKVGRRRVQLEEPLSRAAEAVGAAARALSAIQHAATARKDAAEEAAAEASKALSLLRDHAQPQLTMRALAHARDQLARCQRAPTWLSSPPLLNLLSGDLLVRVVQLSRSHMQEVDDKGLVTALPCVSKSVLEQLRSVRPGLHLDSMPLALGLQPSSVWSVDEVSLSSSADHALLASAVPKMTGLTRVACFNVFHEDVSAVASLPALASLQLGSCFRCDLLPTAESLAKCATFRSLTLSRLSDMFFDLSRLAASPSLRALTLDDCCNFKTPALPNIEQLTLRNCHLYETEHPFEQRVHAIAQCTALRSLSLEGCNFCNLEQPMDLTPLKLLTCLGTLALGFDACCHNPGAALRDLGPLVECVSLHTVELTLCLGVKDVSPLAACPALQTLTLDHCCFVEDIAPLAASKSLRSLVLLDGGVTPRGTHAFAPAVTLRHVSTPTRRFLRRSCFGEFGQWSDLGKRMAGVQRFDAKTRTFYFDDGFEVPPLNSAAGAAFRWN